MATPPVLPVVTNPEAEENARQFGKDFGVQYGPAGGGPRRNIGKEMLQLEKETRELHILMRSMQPPPAFVVNMQNFPLHVNGVLHDGLVAPPCPDHEKYVVYLIQTYMVAVKDGGDGKFTPYAEPPMKLALDFEREFGGEDGQGGVCYLPGTQDILKTPGAKVTRIVDALGNTEDTTVEQVLNRAEARMIAFAQQRYQEAETEWVKPNGQRNIIQEPHRRAALILLSRGLIAQKPVWMTMTRAEANIGANCPSCMAQTQKGQIMCNKCPYVLDVDKAWSEGIINKDNPALRRLGAEKLEGFGFTQEEILWLIPSYGSEKKGKGKKAEKPE